MFWWSPKASADLDHLLSAVPCQLCCLPDWRKTLEIRSCSLPSVLMRMCSFANWAQRLCTWFWLDFKFAVVAFHRTIEMNSFTMSPALAAFDQVSSKGCWQRKTNDHDQVIGWTSACTRRCEHSMSAEASDFFEHGLQVTFESKILMGSVAFLFCLV